MCLFFIVVEKDQKKKLEDELFPRLTDRTFETPDKEITHYNVMTGPSSLLNHGHKYCANLDHVANSWDNWIITKDVTAGSQLFIYYGKKYWTKKDNWTCPAFEKCVYQKTK